MRPRSASLKVVERLFRVCRHVDESVLGSYEITERELVILRVVERGTSAIPQIAAILGVSSASAMKVVESLEDRSLLARTKLKGRRQYQIEITTLGREMVAKHQKLDAAAEAALKKQFGEGIVATIKDIEAALGLASGGSA